MAEYRTDEKQTEGITQEEQIAAYSSVYSVKWHYIGDTSKQSAGHFRGGERPGDTRGSATLAQRENLPEIAKSDVIVPETRHPDCTCGTLTTCTAHD